VHQQRHLIWGVWVRFLSRPGFLGWVAMLLGSEAGLIHNFTRLRQF